MIMGERKGGIEAMKKKNVLRNTKKSEKEKFKQQTDGKE